MDIFSYTTKNTQEVFRLLEGNMERGLGQKEANSRLKQYGTNEFTAKETRWWQIFVRQFASPFIYLLVGAALLALGLGEFVDGLMIVLFLAINATLGFYQEYRSERTLQLLKTYVVSLAKVFRQGAFTLLDTKEIVPGDLVLVEIGDKIPVDVRFIETEGFRVDESILTGESASVPKISDVLLKEAREYYEATNLGFAGTLVVQGRGKGIVLATGRNTVAGSLAKLAVETTHSSNFEKGIGRFARFILKLVGVTLLFVFMANLLLKGGKIGVGELILFSIALAVSVIPESLPVVMTFSLSIGARHLAKKKVVMRRLSAIEDLGGIEVLCSDKTGTLTENKLAVSDIYGKDANRVLEYASLTASEVHGEHMEPFDKALWEKIPKRAQKDMGKERRLDEIPFDPVLRRNIVLLERGGGKEIVTRGAHEAILELCSEFSEGAKKHAENWAAEEGKKGRRVLAVAKKSFIDKRNDALDSQVDGFEFVGAISFVDPIKPSAHEVAKRAAHLGVTIKIITGDSKEVAGAVAHEIGLIDSPEKVITGSELDGLSEHGRRQAIQDHRVFARISPKQKFSIIETLQENYEVGFLGEGINDAPALKIAGVSIAVDTASDVAKEVADIVLLQKNLLVILNGIEEGRKIFANTTKYIVAILATNFGNFFAIAIASLLIPFLPMLPLQILLVILLSDFPMIAISTDTVEKRDLQTPQKYSPKDFIVLALVLGALSILFDFATFAVFFHFDTAVLQTSLFIESILTELVFLFSIRTRRFFLAAPRSSFPLMACTALAFALTLVFPFTTFGQHIFGFMKPTFLQLTIVLSIVFSFFLCTEIVKVLYYKTTKRIK